MPLFSIIVEVHTILEVRASNLDLARERGFERVVDAILAGQWLPGSSEAQEAWGDEIADDGESK